MVCLVSCCSVRFPRVIWCTFLFFLFPFPKRKRDLVVIIGTWGYIPFSARFSSQNFRYDHCATGKKRGNLGAMFGDTWCKKIEGPLD